MSGMGRREGRKAQAKVLRAVLLAGEAGLTGEDLEERCEGLTAVEIEDAVTDLLAVNLLVRVEARLHPSGPATHFDRFLPL